MTQINNLNTEETIERTISLMKLSKTRLAEKCALVGMSGDGSKAELVTRIISKSAKIESDPPKFDMSGLMIRI